MQRHLPQKRDLSRSPLEVTPLAGHIAGRFKVAERDRLDVNPVTWHTLAGHGIAVRGPQRDRLQIHRWLADLIVVGVIAIVVTIVAAYVLSRP